jgi:hypothetical protein
MITPRSARTQLPSSISRWTMRRALSNGRPAVSASRAMLIDLRSSSGRMPSGAATRRPASVRGSRWAVLTVWMVWASSPARMSPKVSIVT